MTAAISVAAAAEGKAPNSSTGGTDAFLAILAKAAEQYPALTIIGGLVALVLVRVVPTWIKAHYRYWGEIDKQRIKFMALRQSSPPPLRRNGARGAKDKQQ